MKKALLHKRYTTASKLQIQLSQTRRETQFLLSTSTSYDL